MEETKINVQDVIHSFRKVAWAFDQLFREETKDHHITFVQLSVLNILSKKRQMGLNELSQSLLLSNSTMSGVIDRLVAAGLVIRQRAAEDRRNIVIKLTKKGKEVQEEVFGEHSPLKKKLAHVLDIPAEDLKHLLYTHDLIIEKLHKKEGSELI